MPCEAQIAPVPAQPAPEVSQAASQNVPDSQSYGLPTVTPEAVRLQSRRRRRPNPYSTEATRRRLIEATDARAQVERENSATFRGILDVLSRMLQILETR